MPAGGECGGLLCNGGLAVLAWFAAAPDASLFHDWQAQWAWKNIALAIVVTQRGFLFALPAGLLLLTSWRTRFFRDGAGWKMPFLGELLLYAAMPTFHIHTFLALSFFLGVLLIARVSAKKQIAQLIGAAFIPAAVLAYLTVGMFKTNAEPMLEDMGQLEEVIIDNWIIDTFYCEKEDVEYAEELGLKYKVLGT